MSIISNINSNLNVLTNRELPPKNYILSTLVLEDSVPRTELSNNYLSANDVASYKNTTSNDIFVTGISFSWVVVGTAINVVRIFNSTTSGSINNKLYLEDSTGKRSDITTINNNASIFREFGKDAIYRLFGTGIHQIQISFIDSPIKLSPNYSIGFELKNDYNTGQSHAQISATGYSLITFA